MLQDWRYDAASLFFKLCTDKHYLVQSCKRAEMLGPNSAESEFDLKPKKQALRKVKIAGQKLIM